MNKIDINNLKIASPCPANWNEMKGSDQQRHCEQCKLTVYDFSQMTSPEIQELFNQSKRRICGRLWKRQDGTVITKDCNVGKSIKRKKRLRIAAMWSLFTTASLGWLTGCGKDTPDEVIMGEAGYTEELGDTSVIQPKQDPTSKKDKIHKKNRIEDCKMGEMVAPPPVKNPNK